MSTFYGALCLLFLYLTTANCQILEFSNAIKLPIPTAEDLARNVTTTDGKLPLGYIEGVLHHPATDEYPNPVYQIEGELKDRYLEIRLQTLSAKASICIKDDHRGGYICDRGTLQLCYEMTDNDLKFVVYCDEACETSDVNYYLRAVVSGPDDKDTWCQNRVTETEFITDLSIPVDIPRKPTPAPMREDDDDDDDDEDSASSAVVSSVILTSVGVLLAKLL